MLRILGRATSRGIVRAVQCTSTAMTHPPPGKMFSLQASLPRLPVPPLDQTLNKYLKSVRPLLSDEEFKNTEQIVQEFSKNPGPKLQTLLEHRASQEENWLSEWWMKTAYLEFRSPVTVNVSPGIVFPRQSYRDKEGQLRYAAKLIAGVLDFKLMIDNQTLPVEHMGKKPLCMTQYYKILSACRTPGKKCDSWTCYPPDQPNAPKSIIVAHNNQLFALDVYGSDGKPLSEAQIYRQLKSLVQESDQVATPVGLLTTENRSTWAKAYSELAKDKENSASLDRIKHSICVVCLDNNLPQDMSDERSVAARQMLHGGGDCLNSGNRWFDKTIQFVVGRDGISGLTYEHTSAEGPPVVMLLDHVVAYCSKNKSSGSDSPAPPTPTKLTFNLSTNIKDMIATARTQLDVLVDDVDLNVFVFNDYGKNFPKSQKMSPDSFLQNAIQLAYYRIHNEPAPHYETGTLRMFHLGRTDTIRSCSEASLEFCKAFVDANTSKEHKAELLRKAVQAHKNYTNEVIQGMGIDRHLMGLKLAAIKNGMNVPDLHMDMAYTLSTHFRMSTSQVPAHSDSVLVFGPVVPDGYGVCYNPQESQVHFGVSAFNITPETSSKNYINMLRKTLLEMRDLFQGSMNSKL
ncbi:carnitine O-acetyltransferase-like [Mizuhopecten yessoensis]|uniref:Carnitine O-acetyltransferase n=1 Tax=Mizuhopecten yessoensis TaxID=6573 RepID=A0A210R0U7_MIZYE|nr:carnitine O-acetyltransferase-like [Mizuhopecten yessoensis]OWF54638.1 Carnitine O-acetyltransferase [Mizuhopecten yessoensis]